MAQPDLIATRLARFALTPLDAPDALSILNLSLLDWAAVALAGQNEPAAQILRAQAIDDAGTPQSTLIGHATKTPARMAALVNGTISHALDYDDTHFAHIGHPSVAVIPAALAMGELTNAPLSAVSEAALIGAEASIRMGLWLGRDHYQVGFHQTATAGAFGATLAAGRLLGLTQTQMEQALGLVATRASGLKAQFGTMGKPLNAGLAASNGVEAAQLAARGFLSAPEAIEGQNGFGPTHHGQGNSDVFDDLGQGWKFPSVQHKFHACCHGLHATLEALRDLRTPADQIKSVHIATHPRWLTVCNIPTPRTGLEAKFSYKQVTAMTLAGHNTARLDSFTDALCTDPTLAQLRDRVSITADDTLTEMQARLQITMTDGRLEPLAHDLDQDPGLATRQARVHAKSTALIGADKTAALWDQISVQGAKAKTAKSFAALLC